MLEAPKQSVKRKRLVPGPLAPPDLVGDSEQALRALEAYANQAEEALGEAIGEAALKDRRIAALEAELRAKQHPASSQPAPAPAQSSAAATARPKIVLPTLSPALGGAAQDTRQALEAVDHHSAAAGRALSELLAVAEEKEQGAQELELQLQETRQEIQQLSQQRQGLEQALSEAQRRLAGSEARIQQLEQELGGVKEANEAAEHQLSQFHDVLEHYVLRCRELERKGSTPASSNESDPSPASTLSPLAQRLKAGLHSG
ncbi:MAG: hypothetical protein R6W06_03190 [Prochlorococcaceae cyanobacterium]